MAAILITILVLLVAGLPIALAVDRRARGALLIGVAFLYGSGLVFAVLLALSILHIEWTLISVAVAGLLGCSVAWMIARFNNPVTQQPSHPVRPHWLDLVTLLTLAGYTVFATLAPVWEWDFWAIWGLKARVFFEHGGIDWRFLESRWNAFAHTDYPLLVTLNYDFAALVSGGWNDRWLGLLLVAWAAAATLIVRALAARETSPLVASLIALAAGPIAASHSIGLAEAALMAFGGAAVLFLRRALLFDDEPAWRHGAILLGLAANTKNEGLALLTSVALAVPWFLLRAVHTLQTDIIEGSFVARLISRLPDTVAIMQLLLRYLIHPWFWVALFAGIVVAPAARRKRETFVLLVTGVQLAFYIGAYFATPADPHWHIWTSWPRLTVQLALPVVFAVIMMLAVSFPGSEESADGPHLDRL